MNKQSQLAFQETLVTLLNTCHDFWANRSDSVIPGTILEKDIRIHGDKFQSDNAYTLVGFAIQFAYDHLFLLANNLAEEYEPFTACTLIRSILEPCAVAAWVVDPKVDTITRISRVYAVRLEAIQEQAKAAQISGIYPQSQIDLFDSRIENIAQDAASRGYQVLRNKNGKVSCIGVQKPGPTSIIREVLNAEFAYRILSAVVHGQPWAIQQMGFKEISRDLTDNTSLHIKKEYPEAVMVFCTEAMMAVSRLIWNWLGYCQISRIQFKEKLEDIVNRSPIPPNNRFWLTE